MIMMFCSDTVIPVNKNDLIVIVSLMLVGFHSVLPLGIRGGENDFCVISQAGGATAKLQEPGWGHIQGEDDFRQSSRGGLLYHDNLLVFHQ